MASLVALLAEAHGTALRLLADSRGMHYQGLHVATWQKHRGLLGARLIKRLRHLETHNYARHVTEPMITGLVAELRDALILDHKARGVSDQHAAPSPAVEYVAPALALTVTVPSPVKDTWHLHLMSPTQRPFQ